MLVTMVALIVVTFVVIQLAILMIQGFANWRNSH